MDRFRLAITFDHSWRTGMWAYNWSLAWFWIIVPLLMLAMMLGCLAMMVRGCRRKGDHYRLIA